MLPSFLKIINSTGVNSKKLFLIDGFGAILSAILLGVVLVEFESIFGLPPSVLYPLAILPIIFAAYDFYSYRLAPQNIGFLLISIALMNLFYCCLSIGLVCYYKETVTFYGWMYILIEIAIVLLLAIVELRVGKRLNKNKV